jgi:hypothetical protein
MTTASRLKPRFALGLIAATQPALNLLQGDERLASLLLARHASGDGGDIDSHDAGLNAEAIRLGGRRILSAYKLLGAGTLWIITEADRSVTTLLTPACY